MIKQTNLFTGKIDIVQEPGDKPQALEYARFKLGSEAGRIIKLKPAARQQAPREQVTLF